MGIVSGVKRVSKSLFNVKGWADSERVMSAGKTIWEDAKQLTVIQQSDKQETFQEAQSRFNMGEDELARLAAKYLLTSFIFMGLAFAAAGYVYYMITHNATHSCLIGVVAIALSFSQFFRYHFWYFQVKKRKLGCTFKEWLNEGILRRKG